MIFSKDFLSFTLYATKTDKDRKGIKKFIANMAETKFNAFSVVKALKQAKLSSTGADQPFFALKNGRPVSRVMLVGFLQARMKLLLPKIPANEWISLRKGGATSAIRAGVPGEIIEKLGHWRSDIYKLYISHDGSDVRSAQLKMSRLATSGC
jgi:hypothetical protein